MKTRIVEWKFSYLNPEAIRTYCADRDLLGKSLWTEFPRTVYEGSPYVEHYERAMNEGVAGSFEAYYPEPLNIWMQLEVYPTPEGIVTFRVTSPKENEPRQLSY